MFYRSLFTCIVFSSACLSAAELNTDTQNPNDVLDATADFEIDEMMTPESNDPIDSKVPEFIQDKDFRLSFAQQVGLNLNDFNEIVSNRFDTRLRWEKLLKEQWYFSFDGKVILRLKGDDQIQSDDDIAADVRLRDFNFQSQFEQLSVKAGFQTIIWGEMDSVAINDIMTPWDYSEFAFTTPEDARLGQAAIVASYFQKESSLTLVYTPYPLANSFPGGEASALLEQVLGTSNYRVEEDFPRPGKDYELGVRFKHTVGSSDIALYAAQVLSDFPQFDMTSPQTATTPEFDISYPQYELAGFSINYSSGSFLWKYETALKNNVYFPGSSVNFRDTFENAIGFDYSSNTQYNATIEVYNQTILNDEGDLDGYKKNNTQIVGRWSKNFFHETLSAIYYVSYQFQFEDVTQSLALQYAVNDFWRIDLNATVFNINNTDSPNSFIDDWDQISVRVTYDL